MTDAREKLEAAISGLGLTIESVFVPFSQSRSADQTMKNLNWKVTLKRNGRDVMTTKYSAGQAHCPAHKKTATQKEMAARIMGRTVSVAQKLMIDYECENGKTAKSFSHFGITGGKPILPDPVDVIWALSQDADVLNSGGFEYWAANFGYDPDSRSAEKTYRDCLELALKLRAAIGEAGLETLRIAGEDF